VSVVLPTFNRVALLQEAIASVEAQTWSSWELLVVDDGSTDATAESLRSRQRIHLLRRAHTGNVASLRNAGLRAATGVYVAFLDSDDRWHPEKLACQVARLRARPDCGWCHGGFAMINTTGEQIPQRVGPPWRPREGWALREVLTTEASISLQTVIVRRELALSVLFDERIPFGDDYDFIVRLAGVACACSVETIVADIREHRAQTSRGGRYDQHLGLAMAYRKCGRHVTDPALRRICQQRWVETIRFFLANARASGQLIGALRLALEAWTLK
jgi:glycosyltransferase involved in cell wall biosynthesis